MPSSKDVPPRFFKNPAALRKWLQSHAASSPELLLGFRKTKSGKGGITYKEALDQALCFGWIDGVRRSLGADGYTIRFTPRKPGSSWSLVNIRRVGELSKLGLMQPPGVKAFFRRDEAKAKRQSRERATAKLDAEAETKSRANERAWKFFQAQAPGYRRIASWWVISARREETRARRLAALIDDCENGRRIGILAPRDTAR